MSGILEKQLLILVLTCRLAQDKETHIYVAVARAANSTIFHLDFHVYSKILWQNLFSSYVVKDGSLTVDIVPEPEFIVMLV